MMNQQMELSTPLSCTIVLGQIPMFFCKVLICHGKILNWLVVSTPLKNMKVSWDYYSQLNGKIKFMLQTTNQLSFLSIYLFMDKFLHVSS
jgi:hypothetical protein